MSHHGAVAPSNAGDPTALDYITALGGLAVPATALLALIALAVLAAAIRFRWFEINASWGKFVLKVQRPAASVAPLLAADGAAPLVEGRVENQAELTAPQEATAQAGAPAPEVEETHEPDFMAYFSARSVVDLDRAYLPFAADLSDENLEFWETEYRSRRAKYGADNGREAVRQLTTDHPTWAYPYAIMLDWSLADHDSQTAEEHLAAGLIRQTSPQFGFVLSAGVKLRYQLYGPKDAAAFCAEWSAAALPERIRAGAFHTLADLLKSAGDIEGQRVALEWAASICPTGYRTVFNLAYSYGDSPGRWSSAMWHYWQILGNTDDGPIARNNLGVLLAHFDKRVQIETYSLAAEDGDLYAIANIANLLIADGHISSAERLLATVQQPGSAAELHGTATTAALAARRMMSEKRDDIRAIVDQESEPYRRSLSKALRNIQQATPTAAGAYASDDSLIVVIIDGNDALCRARIGETDFQGALKQQGTCYAGKITAVGATLLGTYSHSVMVLDEGAGVIRLFKWANAIGDAFKSANFELRYVENIPSPPPPIALPTTLLPTSALGSLASGQTLT